MCSEHTVHTFMVPYLFSNIIRSYTYPGAREKFAAGESMRRHYVSHGSSLDNVKFLISQDHQVCSLLLVNSIVISEQELRYYRLRAVKNTVSSWNDWLLLIAHWSHQWKTKYVQRRKVFILIIANERMLVPPSPLPTPPPKKILMLKI